VAPAPSGAADPVEQARARLDQDADRALTIRASGDGTAEFVGVPAKAEVDNPAVRASMSPAAAAAAHVARYGAAFGTAESGTSLARTDVSETSTGDVVRYQQRVGGLPVVGGEVVVNLRPDRELGSILSTTSDATRVTAAVVAEADAADAALAVARRSTATGADLVASPGERWVYDPAVLGMPSETGARSVWRFEVTGGPAIRRLVLVDDQTGAIVLDLDEINDANRIVCDNFSVPRAGEVACTASPARSEGGPASGVADVNLAYDYSGDTAALYEALEVDLTELVGATVGGTKKLASTVRWCYTGAGRCPYKNAFWNGTQMFYGVGYANGDDVVGHEITHGVTERSSNLFYFAEPGAINESLSDVMGEIVDHRNGAGTDTPGDWSMGEDIAGGAIRSMSNPPAFGDPDRVNGPGYFYDLVDDNAGVHYNSGVANKTAYLISQGTQDLPGGSFNGQTIAGIDSGSDTGPSALTKTATLYLGVIQSLTAGSGFADLADTLDQRCQDLVAASSPGFTLADCDNVHQATLATELRTPVAYPDLPADAPDTCPTGSVKRVLFSSETGDPASKFVAGSTWAYGQMPGWEQNVHSGSASWYSTDPDMIGQSPLVAATGMALPAGQTSYLRFFQTRLLDFDDSAYYDGGTVEVDDLGTPGPAADAASLPWTNGPTDLLSSDYDNPAATRKAFSGFTPRYVASRVDLTSYAGKTIKPQFTMNTDSSVAYPGWWVDDITVYTCDIFVVSSTPPTITGTPRVGVPLSASPGTWTPSTGVAFGFQWSRNGAPIASATTASYTPTATDLGAALTVQVTGTRAGSDPSTAVSAPTAAVAAGLLVKGRPSIKGKARVGSTLVAKPGAWGPSGVSVKLQWVRNGKPIKKATKAKYHLVGVDKGKKISVRVTGTKSGYQTATATSKATGKVKAKPKKRR
jgi:Zn-dependent metalloprotease